MRLYAGPDSRGKAITFLNEEIESWTNVTKQHSCDKKFCDVREPIEEKPSIKYLGVHIDNKLKWKDHIKAVASNVTRAVAIIRHTKNLSLDIR